MTASSFDQRWWPAPAKLNLCLALTGRLANGYHTLQTAFQFTDLHDHLRFEPRDDGRVMRINGPVGVAEDDDLTVKSARALKAQAGVDAGIGIDIDKVIPMGAGLGGGSSDAATTLLVLNDLWGTALGVTALAEIGASLGADIPVFIRARAAWGEGIGDKLTPARFPERVYTVVVPSVSVDTAHVFSHTDLTAFRHPIRIPGPCPDNIGNDLERVTRELYPEVDQVLSWLGQYGTARMTGSGGAVFVSMATVQEAQSACDAVPSPWRGFVVQGCNDHPLAYLATGQDSAATVAERIEGVIRSTET